MKKILLSLYLVFLLLAGQSQGLEKIIVEKYYVANASDAAGSSGTLPAGSVTWRIYADMAPGYYLLQVYGIPTHPLLITTTTSFFNNTDYGAATPAISANNTKKNTVMLDSWLSTGNGCTGWLGLLKSEDNGVNNFVNANGLLKNADASAGIPLTTQDGLMSGSNYDINIVGINTDPIADGSVSGNTISTTNGSWYSTTHPQGPTANNRVLIAQITTDGVLHYEINIEIGKDLGGGMSTAEYYVSSNPQNDEQYDPGYHLSGNLPSVSPTVNITAPTGGSTFHEGDVVPITVNAADADGTVTKVELYVNDVKVGEDATAPYQFNWTSVGGNAKLTAVATDNELNQTTSSPVNITVSGNIPPTVSITTPANGSNYITNDIVAFTASAADQDGTVANVEFFVDNVSQGKVTTTPYQINWTATPAGKHKIKAIATDDKGASTTSSQDSVYVSDNQAPVVSITSGNGTIDLGPYVITATATDIDGSVSKVEFIVDGVVIGEATTAPYQYNWANSAYGRHTLTARTTDNKGAITTSASVTKDTKASPTVSITAPLTGSSSHVGNTLTITANAADADGNVVSVEFFVDGVSIGNDITVPYTANYMGVLGTHILTAKATDNDSRSTTSGTVSITVNNTAPSISITAPINGASAKVGEVIAISADASDADGTIASVEFFVDGVSIGNDNTPPYAFNYTGVLGSHSLTTKATDNNGTITTSSSVTLTINATGISDISAPGSLFIVYPNPVTDVFTFSITAAKPVKIVSYKIINMEGRMIISKIIGTKTDKYMESVNISSIANGQYMIELSIEGHTLFQKIIKQ